MRMRADRLQEWVRGEISSFEGYHPAMTDEVLAGWDGFFEWATLFYAMEDFDQEERDYKFRAVEPLIHSLELLSTGGEWLPELRRGFTNTSSNIVS